MKVLVRHFAQLRERRGRDHETLELEPGATVGGLYRSLFPPGPAGVLPVMYAVNHAWAPADAALADGDEVAFIPPVGGGL